MQTMKITSELPPTRCMLRYTRSHKPSTFLTMCNGEDWPWYSFILLLLICNRGESKHRPRPTQKPRRASHFCSNEMFLPEPGNKTLASYPSTCWKCVA